MGIVVLFLVWLNVDASHTEVLGGTVAAVIAVIYGVLRNTGPVSITWAQIGFKRMAKCFRLMLQQLLKDSGVNAATATTRPVSNWICCHVGAIPMPCSSSFFCEVEEWLGTMLSRPAVGQGKALNQLACDPRPSGGVRLRCVLSASRTIRKLDFFFTPIWG